MTIGMTKKPLKVNFNLSNVRDDSATVVLTATVNGERARFSPGIVINPIYWDKKRAKLDSRVNLDRTHPKGVNEVLREWREYAQAVYAENENITKGDFIKILRERIEGKTIDKSNTVKSTLDGFAADYVAERKANTSNPRDFDNLATTARYLARYAEAKGKAIYWRNIDRTFAWEFKSFLERQNFNLSQNQVSNIFSRLRHIIRAAGSGIGNKGYHSNQSHELPDFRISKEDSYKHYLNFAELDKMLSIDFPDAASLEEVRDMFVLSCYTGLRLSDAKTLNRDNLHVTSSGQEQIKIYCTKPKRYVNIPLLPKAKQILEKYNWELPEYGDGDYNTKIKEVAARSGIDTPGEHTQTRAGKKTTTTFKKWEKVSSHDARRSFATNFYEKGLPASLLMQITGHSREQMFFNYICTSPEKSAELMAQMITKIDLND
jgi:integrase